MKFKGIRHAMRLAAASAIFLAGVQHAQAVESDEEPIIVFHTDIYNQADVDNVFHIILGAKENTYVDVDFGYGPIEEEVGQAIFNGDTQDIEGTFISCSVSREGIVKIYGDPLLIDYVKIEGCYVDEISFPKLTEVSILNLEHNLLKSLDISHMKKLQALYLSDNPFNVSPLIVGNDKPELTILEMSLIDHLDPDFSITGYPNLVSCAIYSVPTLKKIDPTKCPELMRLSIDGTAVSSVDVSKNQKLLILDISQTNITSVDLSHNPYLTEFYCTNDGSSFSDTKMKEVDVTNNPELKYLFISGNNLETIDLSKNTKLTDLYAARNSFKSIDLSNNQALYNLNLTANNLDFATLPAPRNTFGEYNYSQKSLPLERSYVEGAQIDMSSRVLRENTLTTAKLFRTNRQSPSDVVELGEEYFEYDNGKFTLKKECPDSVFVEFYNTMFIEAPLRTANFMVKNSLEIGKPSPLVNIGFSSAATNVEMSVGIGGATEENPVTFYVDFGKGALTEFKATSSTIPATPNVTGRRAGDNTLIYIPEGYNLTAFGVSKGRISTTDFSQAPHITELVINNAALKEIDLLWNSALTYLNLDNNDLTSISLEGANGRYSKNMLSNISIANNKLRYVELNSHTIIHKLNLSNNQLTELLIDRCYDLTDLNVSNNLLTSLDLNDCMGLTTLDCSHNNLTSLPVPYYCPLSDLNITYNDITFADLAPAGSYETYKYAPQSKVRVPKKAPGVNLKNYMFTDDKGQTTSFVWRTVEGNKLLTDEQISEDNGSFRFIDIEMGEVYCSMTHPAFPDFEGENAYMTTDVLAADMPKNIFATFTPTASGVANLSFAGKENGTVIYIDWKGNGNLEEYLLKTTYTRFTANITPGVEVKCYSYEDNDDVTVFSVENVKVSKLDASKMRQCGAFSWSKGNLGEAEFKLPESSDLTQLTLFGNGLTDKELAECLSGSKYPNLEMINVSSNNLETLDLTPYKKMKTFYASANKINSVNLDNPLVWNASLEFNELESVDLSKLPALQQLYISDNKLTSLDLEGLQNLGVIGISRNNMTIATLPLPREQWRIYEYSPQNPVEIEVKNGDTVDLSSQISRDGEATEYRWFVGSPWFDEYGELAGEELIPEEEYTLENGVTKFKLSLDDLMCVMTNPLFPGLYLYTYLVDITGAGIDDITADENAPVEYYDLTGKRVVNPGPGIYVRRQGAKTTKVLIK